MRHWKLLLVALVVAAAVYLGVRRPVAVELEVG